MFAIVNGVKTSHRAIAVCELRTYDVWGNGRDGYEVNDSFSAGRVEIPVVCEVSNLPRHPGATDDYRSFSDSGSFSAEVVVSFTLTDKQCKDVLGVKGAVEVDGDDIHYYVNRARDGYPMGEIEIVKWEPAE